MQLTSNRHPHMKLHFYIIFSFILLLTSCKRNFQYSVLEVNPTAENLNTKAITAIKEKSIGDTLKFLIIADTQVSYDELELFVKHSNAKYSNSEVDFILHAGDFTDYGANFEYNLYYDEVKKSNFPIISTIGNHDMLSNGRTIFQKMFGNENFSFEIEKYKFIAFNSNGREVNFKQKLPNMDWLSQEIQNGQQQKIIYLSHVSPFTTDFDPTLKDDFQELIESHPQSLLSIHGHTHSFDIKKSKRDDFVYLTAPTINKRQYVEVTIFGTTADIKQKFY